MDYIHLLDDELCCLAKEGDNNAYNVLEQRYKGLIIKLARSFFIYKGGEEDLVQEARLGFLGAVRSYNKKSQFPAFAKLCIKNSIISAIRKNNKITTKLLNLSISLSGNEDDDIDKSEIIASFDDPEMEYINKESLKELTKKVTLSLSDLENEILNLYLSGLSYLDVAKKLNKNEKSVDNAIQRIRKKIKNVFNEEEK